jgi:uncharacterized membrane protein YfcA
VVGSFCLGCTGLFDSRFPWAVLAAALAGLVRGFSGFGAALIFIPLGGALYGPRIAVLILWVIDVVATVPYLPYHFRRAHWGEIVPLVIGSTVALPLGVWILVHVDPVPLRWAICGVVLASTLGLASGWRYQRQPTTGISLSVGGVAGLSNGAVGIGGPPLILFWLGGQAGGAQTRSNIFAYFGLTSFVTLALYLWQGIFTLPILMLGLALLPAYGIPLLLGDWLFRRSTDTWFRRIAFWLCGAAAVMGLPIWQ